MNRLQNTRTEMRKYKDFSLQFLFLLIRSNIALNYTISK